MNSEEILSNNEKTKEYLAAKAKYDKLLSHINDYNSGKFVHQGPTLSFIMRTQGKRKEALEEILLGIASQTCHDFELVFIPHKVDDETLNNLKVMISELPDWLQNQTRIMPLNSGNRTAPLNYGFSIAKGLYALIVDDDDLIMEDYAESFIEGIKSHYGNVMHGYAVPQEWFVIKDDAGNNLLRASAEPTDVYCRHFSIENEMSMNFCPPIALAFPLFAFKELDIKFDETLDTTEDWDYLMRCAALCGVYDIKKVISVYRLWINSANSHTEHSKKVWDDNYKKLVKRFSEMPILYPFKDKGDRRYPLRIECFYGYSKGSFSEKRRFVIPFDYDDQGKVVAVANNLEKLGAIAALRIDPDVNGNRVVNNFKLKITLSDGREFDLSNSKRYSNGGEHAKDSFTFIDDDPNICYNLSESITISRLEISFFINEFVTETKYKPRKAHRSFIKRCKRKAKKILRWVRSRI